MSKPKINKNEPTRLFPENPPFKIVRIGESASRKQTDDLKVLRSLLLESENMYPSIERWYIEKVVPGLKTCERVAYLAYEGEIPVASAVLKLGEHAKFCHVRIHQAFRDLRLGQMIFTQMAFHARHQASIQDIHFTLPESLWLEKGKFFASFGFNAASKATRQYRQGEEELYCSAPISTVWGNALEKLHLLNQFSPGGFSISGKILLSVQPSYAERIFAGKKQIEFRRKFSHRWKGRQAVVYGTLPIGSLMGEVTISEITPGNPEEIWDRFGGVAGCTYDEFRSYVHGTDEVYAIELTNVNPYLSPIGIAQISHLIREDLRPPQSFLDVKLNEPSPWGKAISIASLMHSRQYTRGATL